MADPSYFSEVRRLAYDQTDGKGPGIVFLGGFRSTKNGIKAHFLEDWAKSKKRAFLRFDYSGHGDSTGEFRDGTIGTWAEDAEQIIKGLTKGRQVLVGSSMGGWIALLLARRMPERIAAIVTIAAAPDFTERKYWYQMSEAERIALDQKGFIEVESLYDDGPYIITRQLIEDGRNHLILDDPLHLPMPVRFLHGANDEAVETETALRLFERVDGPDIRLTLVKGADHRFSAPENLKLIAATLEDISAR
ncbi:MAG: alpha/beta hydrolase [Paracoccaceae bacterium]|nr:alpha/beta hydrolase [Paracoccaceae bacterium]